MYTRPYLYVCVCMVYRQNNITKIKIITKRNVLSITLNFNYFTVVCIQGFGDVGEELKIKQGFSRRL